MEFQESAHTHTHALSLFGSQECCFFVFYIDRRVKYHVPSEALGRRSSSLPDFALIRVLVNELNCNIHVQPMTPNLTTNSGGLTGATCWRDELLRSETKSQFKLLHVVTISLTHTHTRGTY